MHTLLANMRGRAPSASRLWARAHRKTVDDALGDGNIGDRQKVVARLFSELPDAKQRHWRRKAAEFKEAKASDPDQCYMYVDLLKSILMLLTA